jgi:hypothetical protein
MGEMLKMQRIVEDTTDELDRQRKLQRESDNGHFKEMTELRDQFQRYNKVQLHGPLARYSSMVTHFVDVARVA